MKGKQVSDNKGIRRCLACGKIHKAKETCPIILNKINRSYNNKKHVFLMGNILLECIRKKVDLYQILLEIAEQMEEAEEIYANHIMKQEIRNFSTELTIDYFALSLNCNSKAFFKSSKRTIDEFYNLLRFSDYISGDIFFEEGIAKEITLELTTDAYKECECNMLKKQSPWLHEYSFIITKLIKSPTDSEYYLSIKLPMEVRTIYEGNEQHDTLYCWNNLTRISSQSIMLAEDEGGKLKELFDDYLNLYWTNDELVQELSFDDSRFDLWMTKLENATKSGALEWSQNGKHEYSTCYEKTDIHLEYDLRSFKGEDSFLLYVRCLNGIGVRFGHRIYEYEFGEEPGELEKDRELKPEHCRIRSLVELIEHEKETKSKRFLNENIKVIAHTDIIVVAKSMICHNNQHAVTPYRGIVKLLLKDGKEVDYEVYVGYCRECNYFFMFKSDYFKMKEVGTPLCAVYQAESLNNEKQLTKFRYKSQSVLNAMGYTVNANLDLEEEEREKILVRAIKQKLFSINDLISFLNWLIQTRKTQPKYESAVQKWTNDMEFIKEYNKQERESIDINQIIL